MMRFKKGDKVYIIGPSSLGDKAYIGTTIVIETAECVVDTWYYADSMFTWFPESSLAPIYTAKEIFTLLLDDEM